MQKKKHDSARPHWDHGTLRSEKVIMFCFCQFALGRCLVMSGRRERKKKMHEQYSWSRHGPTSRFHLPKINGVVAVCFPRESGGNIFRFKRKMRRHALLKTRNLNRGTIPSNNVINISLFGRDRQVNYVEI